MLSAVAVDVVNGQKFVNRLTAAGTFWGRSAVVAKNSPSHPRPTRRGPFRSFSRQRVRKVALPFNLPAWFDQKLLGKAAIAKIEGALANATLPHGAPAPAPAPPPTPVGEGPDPNAS